VYSSACQNGETWIDSGEMGRKPVTHDRRLTIAAGPGLLFFSLLKGSEGVEGVVASVHGVCQGVQLPEHGLVCDPPPHGLVDDDLRPEQDPAEAILHVVQCRRLIGALARQEIYASSG